MVWTIYKLMFRKKMKYVFFWFYGLFTNLCFKGDELFFGFIDYTDFCFNKDGLFLL